MEYKSLIRPTKRVPSFDDFIQPYADELIRKIEDHIRHHQVQLKQQGIQSRSELREMWPDYSAEYRKLLNRSSATVSVSDAARDEPKKKQGEYTPLMDDDESSDNNTEDDTSADSALDRKGLLPFKVPTEVTDLNILREEVFWKLNVARGMKVNKSIDTNDPLSSRIPDVQAMPTQESKIFFFNDKLFRLTFGYNQNDHTTQDYPGGSYHLHISNAEIFKEEVKVRCTFRIHDPATEKVLLEQAAESNYIFRPHIVTTAGFENFSNDHPIPPIQQRAVATPGTAEAPDTSRDGIRHSNFVDAAGKMLLSVVVTSKVTSDGRLVGE
mmetsp:Transcript_3387/g.5267  ORF Transcript_3387/g.5267 Transcript_3387/m.5267 type:complete len:325 (-) Transcript_3387:61-1035(-)